MFREVWIPVRVVRPRPTSAFAPTRNSGHISHPEFCLFPVADERRLWIRVLEAEERERLESMRASLSAFESQADPTAEHIDALLVAALQGQLTLFRMSRVFPKLGASKCVDVSRALRHGPTAALACQLRRCWGALGVTDATLKSLLREAVTAVGIQTRSARVKSFSVLIPNLQRGVDPNAHEALAAEGAGQ